MRLTSAVVLLSVAAMAQPPQGPPPGQRREPPAPKNLKLLQPANLMPTMQAFRAALGVQCAFCHVEGNFASDENPKKEIARHMIVLAREVNEKFPDGKMHVTCYTCHRGATEPAMTPPASEKAGQ